MTIEKLAGGLQLARAFISRNSPTILTGVGAAGVIATAMMTHQAAVKAFRLSEQAAIIKGESLTFQEYLAETWRVYIPPVLSASISVAAVIGSHAVSAGRIAALTAICGAAERSLEAYKGQIEERLTKAQAGKVREGVALERVSRDYDKTEIVHTGYGNTLVYEAYTGRFFRSDIEAVRKAANDFNQSLIQETFLSINDWFSRLGLGVTKY